MPTVRRYLYAAAHVPAQPDTTLKTLVTNPDGSRLLLSTDHHGNIQSELVPLDAFLQQTRYLPLRHRPDVPGQHQVAGMPGLLSNLPRL